MAGRPKKARGMTTTTTKLKRKPRTKTDKPLVRINKDIGRSFETFIFKYLTEYLKSRDISGLVYRFPDNLRNWEQPYDIAIDSSEFLFIGVECKAINDAKLINDKIYLKKLSRANAKHEHQFKKQHIIFKESGRYGLLAFRFIDRNIAVFVSHDWVYHEIENETIYILVDDIIKNGYLIDESNTGSLKLFIKNKCKTT